MMYIFFSIQLHKNWIYFGHATWCVGSWFPDQGFDLAFGSEHRILTTGHREDTKLNCF